MYKTSFIAQKVLIHVSKQWLKPNVSSDYRLLTKGGILARFSIQKGFQSVYFKVCHTSSNGARIQWTFFTEPFSSCAVQQWRLYLMFRSRFKAGPKERPHDEKHLRHNARIFHGLQIWNVFVKISLSPRRYRQWALKKTSQQCQNIALAVEPVLKEEHNLPPPSSTAPKSTWVPAR